MYRDIHWSRRTFLQGIGWTTVFGPLNKVIRRNRLLSTRFEEVPSVGFAYVGSTDNVGDSGIHVFEVCGDHWSRKQSIPSRSPISLVLHPNQQCLYAANEVDEYEGLPRGTIEAYKIAPDGSLTLMNRQPLSLSGTRPRHIAISPDGKYLVVAVHRGGAYNLLPITCDGSVGRVTQIVKEVGAGPDPVHQTSAHPHTVVFDKSGRHFLATDEGCDRLSVFSFQNGQMMRTLQMHSHAATKPGHFAIHPSSKFLYVSNTLDGSIDCYRWQSEAREVKFERRAAANLMNTTWDWGRLIISQSGQSLYVACASENVSVWEINPETGALSTRQQWSLKNRSLQILVASPDNRRLIVADSCQHTLFSIPIHAESGELGSALPVAKIRMAKSLVMKYI
jgi:6-phosphogluconolactonase